MLIIVAAPRYPPPGNTAPISHCRKRKLQIRLHVFLYCVFLNSVRNISIERETQITPHSNPHQNMKRKIIALGAITLIAFIPVAMLSVEAASSSQTAPLPVTPTYPASSAQAKAEAPAKTLEKKSAATTKPASRASSKSKTSTTRSRSSQSAPKDETGQASREQRQAKEKVADLTTTQKSKMLSLLNEGDAEQLASIKGISTTRATAIEKARPFNSIDEVVLVRGIGETTFAGVIAHARSLTARRSSSSSGKSKSSKTSKTSKS